MTTQIDTQIPEIKFPRKKLILPIKSDKPSLQISPSRPKSDPHQKQNNFLKIRMENKHPVIITTSDTISHVGIITAYDIYTIVLENNQEEKLIFKHAIIMIRNMT